MQCTVNWTGPAARTGSASAMTFVAQTGSGHTVVMDGAPDAAKPDNGGANLAPRPMETLLAGTGGCTAYDVVLILKRGRQNISGCAVQLTAERAETDPKVFTKNPYALHRQRYGVERWRRRACHCHEPRQILLSHHHAG